jgi:ParB-like chromosome segregation protein Spo0J
MAAYQWGTTDWLALEELDLSFRRYRLQPQEAEEAMLRSLRRYGQLSPVVVGELEGRLLLLDGFKRHAAARRLAGLETLWARRLEVDARTAKAAICSLNSLSRPVQALEEAWIVQALVREEGLSQPAVAELLGRHKSWVCRRLALLEKLAPEVREDLGLGLLSPTVARQLTRLPAGNQVAALAAARRESLTAQELRRLVDRLVAAQTEEPRRFLGEQPQPALGEREGEAIRRGDVRLSPAGHRLSRRLTQLFELLGGLESWLREGVPGGLRRRDREPLRPGLQRLRDQAQDVAERIEDFLQEGPGP